MKDAPPPPDESFAAIAGGDKMAFGRWMIGVEPRLRVRLRSFASAVDIEVVVQEAFLRAWQVAPEVEPPTTEALTKLCFRVARNLAIDEVRRSKLHPIAYGEALPELEVETPVCDPFLRRAIQECQGALPRQPRAALEARLSARGGQRDEQLAEGMQMRLNTFLKNVGRARRLLMECLTRAGVELGLPS